MFQCNDNGARFKLLDAHSVVTSNSCPYQFPKTSPVDSVWPSRILPFIDHATISRPVENILSRLDEDIEVLLRNHASVSVIIEASNHAMVRNEHHDSVQIFRMSQIFCKRLTGRFKPRLRQHRVLAFNEVNTLPNYIKHDFEMVFLFSNMLKYHTTHKKCKNEHGAKKKQV